MMAVLLEHRLCPQRHRKAPEGTSPLLLRTLVTYGDVGCQSRLGESPGGIVAA